MTEESHMETLKSMCKTSNYASELSSDAGYEMVCTYAKSHPDEQKIIQEVYTYLLQFKHFDLSNYKKLIKITKPKQEKQIKSEYLLEIINNNYKPCYRIVSLCIYYYLFKRYNYKQLYNLEIEDRKTNNYIDFASNKIILRINEPYPIIDDIDPEFALKLKDMITKRNLDIENDLLKPFVFLTIRNNIIRKEQLLATLKKNTLELKDIV